MPHASKNRLQTQRTTRKLPVFNPLTPPHPSRSFPLHTSRPLPAFHVVFNIHINFEDIIHKKKVNQSESLHCLIHLIPPCVLCVRSKSRARRHCYKRLRHSSSHTTQSEPPAIQFTNQLRPDQEGTGRRSQIHLDFVLAPSNPPASDSSFRIILLETKVLINRRFQLLPI